MKTPEEWAEEFPIIVPNPYPVDSPLALQFKEQYRNKYIDFIRRVKADAFSRSPTTKRNYRVKPCCSPSSKSYGEYAAGAFSKRTCAAS